MNSKSQNQFLPDFGLIYENLDSCKLSSIIDLE